MKAAIQNSKKQHRDMQVWDIMQIKSGICKSFVCRMGMLKTTWRHGDEFGDDFIMLADIFRHSILWI